MRLRFRARHALAVCLPLVGITCSNSKLAAVSGTVDTFTQGATNQNVLAFTQSPALVDVLFVVRNGPSMCEKQQQLVAKFQSFINALQQQNLDWQVGVVATDFSDPQFQGKLVAASGNPTVLNSSTPNLAQVFSENVLAVGYNASPQSQGLLAGLAALTPPLVTGANAGFMRANASLAVVIVSDQDDYSFLPPPPTPDYYVNFFVRSYSHLKGAGNEKLVSVSAITGADANGNPADCTCSGCATNPSCIDDDSTGTAGTRYAAVANGTSGLVQSICATDFGPLLTTLAGHLGGLTRTYDLQNVPLGQALDPSTITITVTPVTGAPYTVPENATNGWSYDVQNQAIDFSGTGVPPPNAKVTIAYTLLERAFPLSFTPSVSSITVQVLWKGATSNVPQTTNDPNLGWAYDASNNTIVFGIGNIPPAGSTINVTYQLA
jgi:hypothetical protein